MIGRWLIAAALSHLIAAGHEGEVQQFLARALHQARPQPAFTEIRIESDSIVLGVAPTGRLVLRAPEESAESFAQTKSFALAWDGPAPVPESIRSFGEGLQKVDDGTFWAHVAPVTASGAPVATVSPTRPRESTRLPEPSPWGVALAWVEVLAWLVLFGVLLLQFFERPRFPEARAYVGVFVVALLIRFTFDVRLPTNHFTLEMLASPEHALALFPSGRLALLWLASSFDGHFPLDWGLGLFPFLDATGCVLGAVASCRYFGRRGGWFSGMVLACWPSCILSARTIDSTGSSLFLFALVVVVLTQSSKSRLDWIAFSCSVLLLVACLGDALIPAWAAFIAGGIPWTGRGWRMLFLGAGVCAVEMLFVLLPYRPVKVLPWHLLPELTRLGAQSQESIRQCHPLYVRTEDPDGLSSQEAIAAMQTGFRARHVDQHPISGACALVTIKRNTCAFASGAERLVVSQLSATECEKLRSDPHVDGLRVDGCAQK